MLNSVVFIDKVKIRKPAKKDECQIRIYEGVYDFARGVYEFVFRGYFKIECRMVFNLIRKSLSQ